MNPKILSSRRLDSNVIPSESTQQELLSKLNSRYLATDIIGYIFSNPNLKISKRAEMLANILVLL